MQNQNEDPVQKFIEALERETFEQNLLLSPGVKLVALASRVERKEPFERPHRQTIKKASKNPGKSTSSNIEDAEKQPEEV